MTSTATRVIAGVAAVAAALVVAGCSSQPDAPTQSSGIPENPIITGEPAGFNADDVAFATNMVPHHKQAIELAKLVPERSTDPGVRTLADQIVAAQQPEINVLNVLLVQWNENPDIGADTDSPDHGGHGQDMQGMVDDATIAKLKSLRGTEFDTLWLESMIRHHRGAVEMAKAEIANGKNVDAIAMAQAMVAAQESEIAQMKKMLEGNP